MCCLNSLRSSSTKQLRFECTRNQGNGVETGADFVEESESFVSETGGAVCASLRSGVSFLFNAGRESLIAQVEVLNVAHRLAMFACTQTQAPTWKPRAVACQNPRFVSCCALHKQREVFSEHSNAAHDNVCSIHLVDTIRDMRNGLCRNSSAVRSVFVAPGRFWSLL